MQSALASLEDVCRQFLAPEREAARVETIRWILCHANTGEFLCEAVNVAIKHFACVPLSLVEWLLVQTGNSSLSGVVRLSTAARGHTIASSKICLSVQSSSTALSVVQSLAQLVEASSTASVVASVRKSCGLDTSYHEKALQKLDWMLLHLPCLHSTDKVTCNTNFLMCCASVAVALLNVCVSVRDFHWQS